MQYKQEVLKLITVINRLFNLITRRNCLTVLKYFTYNCLDVAKI